MGSGNISPRLGLAYRLTDAIVIRGGYGINYDPYPLAFVRNLLGNYPSSINLSLPQASRSPRRAGCATAFQRFPCRM